jgi:hypothetical protein
VKRHWRLWTVLALLLLSLGVGSVLLATREPWPVRAYDRLKLGMTREEVEGVVGMPAGNYRTPIMGMPLWRLGREAGIPWPRWWTADAADRADTAGIFSFWYWDDYCISVAFDKDKLAIGLFLLEEDRQTPGFFERVRRFLGL